MARVLEVCAAGLDGAHPSGVAPTDLVLVRGEGVFETVRLYGGRPFRLDEHLARLANSAAAVEVDLRDLPVRDVALRAAAGAAGGDAVLRIVCTKGEDDGGQGRAVWAICSEIPDGLEAERARGLTVTLLGMAVDPLARAASPWLLPGIKSTSYAVNMATQRAARALGADDAIFTGLGGELLESPTSSVWLRTGSTLLTPSLELGILAGVTRAAVAELAPGLGYKLLEGVFTTDDLLTADEVFLTSSVREVMPVVAVDPGDAGGKRPVGDGRPGPAAVAAQAGLRELAAV
jgi:4-amino-4-deoxychorismate lyase